MSNLPEDNSAWLDGIYQLEETDPVEGGPGGIDNLQATQLGNRTAWLKARTMAALRMEDINQISGTYNVSTSDIGQVMCAHSPSGTIVKLPPLSAFPKGNPLCLVVAEVGTGDTVTLECDGSDLIGKYLDNGDGVGTLALIQGTRMAFIATETEWVIVLITAPSVVVAGFSPGDIKFTAAPTTVSQPGFLLCAGQTLSRLTYSALFAAIGITWGDGDGATTFQLPDYRDRFPRIYNGGQGLDVGREFGTYQSDGVKDHVHNAKRTRMDDVGDQYEPNHTNDGTDRGLYTGDDIQTGNINGADGGGTETRPVNFGVNGWIKY